MPWMDSEAQRRSGSIYAVDHSFKVTKHIGQVNGVKTFMGLHTGMNEYGEIRLFTLVQSTAFSQIKAAMSAAYNTMSERNQPLPSLCYTDRCCGDRAHFEEVWPSLASAPAPLRPLALPVPPVYVRTSDDYNLYALPVLTALNALPDGMPMTIGLDTEWVVSTTGPDPGKQGKVCVVQIACRQPCGRSVDGHAGD